MMKIGDKYNWPGQPERLVYLGRNRSGNGYWHQFAKVESPETVWCEVVDADLHMLEETRAWRCDDCRSVGALHCANPDECGGMKLVPNYNSPTGSVG